MDLGLRGRRAAVAAASAGLGLGAAKALAAEGVAVAVCGRNRERVDAAVAQLDEGAVGLVADMADADQAAGFVAEAAERLGGTVDIVVANAGGPPPGTFASTDLDAYRDAVDLNLLSSIAMCRAAVPAMQAQGWGRVVAVTSIGVRQPPPHLMASATARAGLTAFLKVLATEVAADGVTVNSVQPGLHDTERVRQLHGGAAPDEVAAGIPVGRIGDADDFGAVVAFLCSEQARFVTGTGLLVDGGAYPGLL
ncbi:MAG TPA: SDR family oxidoreductase [Acidimicrobiales bacterium]|nr:SDR family oxidoreductase [Acidimicrobiales bacterium]